MSYTTVNGMRSTRYPLSGGCGCGCVGGCSGMGDTGRAGGVLGIVALGAVGVGLLAFMARGSAPRVSANARRRRRRRRR